METGVPATEPTRETSRDPIAACLEMAQARSELIRPGLALAVMASLVCALGAGDALAQSEATVAPAAEAIKAEVERAGLDPGFAAGIIAGSHTVTAVIGVATSALQSHAWNPPPGTSADQVGANIAAGYAISYVLSSIGTILLIRYLPKMFGRDPVAAAEAAEAQLSGGASDPVPGAAESLTFGFSPLDIRTFRVEHETVAGKTVEQLFGQYPDALVPRVVRDGAVIEPADNPTIRIGDTIAVRADAEGRFAALSPVDGATVAEL